MSSRQHAMRTAGVIAVVLVTIIGVLLLGRGGHEPSEQGMTGEKLAPEVRVVKARTDTIRSVRTLPATVEPTRVARLASPAEGPVARLLVREGDLVKSGQLLVLIGHILLDALARLRARKTTEKRASTVWVQRFNSHFRAQHLLLVLSVGALFLSGLFG